MSEDLSVYDKTVYSILCSYASSEDGSCYPSYQTIARKAGCSRRKVIDVIARLERIGLVEKQVQFNSVGDNTSNLYTVKPMQGAPDALPSGAKQSPPSAFPSPPDAEDSPKLNSYNDIQSNENHSSVQHKVTETRIDGKLILIQKDKLKTASSYRILPLIPEVEKGCLQKKSGRRKISGCVNLLITTAIIFSSMIWGYRSAQTL